MKRLRPWLNSNKDWEPYIPLDELLAKPSIKILRTLRRFDELSFSDLTEVLGIHGDKLKCDATQAIVMRLKREGLIAWRGRGCAHQYRVTKLGRQWLELALEEYLTRLDARKIRISYEAR